MLEGTMVIEVEERDYTLNARDSVAINTVARHLVEPNGAHFLVRLLPTKSKGKAGKFLA